MVIETNLTKDQFVRLSILRHFQRIHFYVFALIAAGLTAWGLMRGPLIFILVGWVPFLVYIFVGVFTAVKDGRDEDNPVFSSTRYEFTKKGVSIDSKVGKSNLGWQDFISWKTMTKCYVLTLTSGAILAIPQTAVPVNQITKFESLLNRNIGE